MSLRNPVRQWYEAYVKQARDERVWRNYVQEQAREEGFEQGRAEGREQGRTEGREQGRTEGREQGMAEGKEQGMVQGEEYKLTEMVCKKLKKGKAPETIADELEETIDRVGDICRAAKPFAPEYEAEKVFKSLSKQKQK